jgi:hypothetical protein
MFYPMFMLGTLSRFTLIILRIFTGMFIAFESTGWAIVGWLFAPCTTLTYLMIINNNGGNLGDYWPLMILTAIIDFLAGLAPIVDEKCDTMGVFKY